MMKPSRPTGISVLAILELLGGVVLLLAGIGIAAAGGSILTSMGYGGLGGIAAVAGGALAIFGLFALLVGWGLWTGKGWAWVLAVILTILGILGGLGSLAFGAITGIVGLVIDILILWYLLRPNVKSYFGRGSPAMSTTAPTPPPPPATTS